MIPRPVVCVVAVPLIAAVYTAAVVGLFVASAALAAHWTACRVAGLITPGREP